MHLMRQRTFYPIYPPPDHVCIDFEAWNKYAKIDVPPKIFIAVSDLVTFNKVFNFKNVTFKKIELTKTKRLVKIKEVNNCACLNPGRLIKGTSNGTYAQLTFLPSKLLEQDASNSKTQTTSSNVSVSIHKI
jgi:DNA polymerase alpha subunit B